MDKIINIEEVFDLRLGNIGRSSDKSQIGVAQILNALQGYGCYDGYKITTSEHKYLILIENGQSCCETWGYFTSEDDYKSFIGKELISFELTDIALNNQKVEESGYYGDESGGIQFVNLKCSDGSVLQFAVYNAHNGYYGHPIIIAKDEDIILNDTL